MACCAISGSLVNSVISVQLTLSTLPSTVVTIPKFRPVPDCSLGICLLIFQNILNPRLLTLTGNMSVTTESPGVSGYFIQQVLVPVINLFFWCKQFSFGFNTFHS